jgi:hypothetical protein
LKPLREKLPLLLSLYEHLIFAVSSKTSKQIADFLESSPNVTVVSSNGYGFGARNAFAAALNFEDPYHWIDCDRILHWLTVYPDELRHLLESPPNEHYIILGRTERARLTHPKSWVYCEAPCNDLASRRFGIEMDICVANVFLSREAVRWILNDSVTDDWGILTEWPITVIRNAQKNALSYVAIEGNEWEDPDYYKEEISLAGGLEQWKAQRYDSEAEWLKRFQNSADIISPLVKMRDS